MPDNQSKHNEEILTFFESVILRHSGETKAAYGRVIKTLGKFLSIHGLSLASLTETMAMDWAVELLRKGLSPKNVRKYVDILASLVNSAAHVGLLPPLR